MKRKGRRLIGSRSSKARSALPTGPICSPTALPVSLRPVLTCWCAANGKGRAGATKMAARSISSPCCGRPKVAASIGRSLSNARSAPILRCVWSPSASPKRALQKRDARPGGTPQREGYQVSKGTLEAADWVILLTSLPPDAFSTEDVLDLYRLRWRIELGFKRLKSLIGLKGPPGFDQRSARPYVLVHLLIILLLDPLVHGLPDSPPR